MSDRLKRALVESFIGTIALGYLLAQALLYFVGIFSRPVEQWVQQRMYPTLAANASQSFPIEAALPQAISFIVLLLVFYVLLRWLYFQPMVQRHPSLTRTPDSGWAVIFAPIPLPTPANTSYRKLGRRSGFFR